jgi:hypothetical protein
MNRSLKSILWVLLFFASLPVVLAQQDGWPRTLPLEHGEVTIYSLQVHEMSEDIIHYRAALAYRSSPDAEPIFGAGWFESRAEVDQVSKIVHPQGLNVTETRFPDGTFDVQPGLSKALAEQSNGWNLDFSLDELQTAIETAEAEADSIESQNTSPPRIIYRDHPALLVSIDGEPVLREIENSPYEAVINTPYPLITDGKNYYLNAAKDVWYRAGKVTGPYHFDSNPPVDIAAMVNHDVSDTDDGSTPVKITAANAPEIVVSTEAAELVVTEGPAAFVPLVDDLLVLQNSDDDVFMHVSTQQFYIVLAGRWYHAKTLNGPWTYQAADELPQVFARIPEDSNQADSRVYVAGTEEANEAVLDAYVPQTAAVARGEVDIDVVYDGEPNFEAVDGADLEYADNTGSTVLHSNRLYYLVENGVWYVSTQANGPWQVSEYRPQQVDRILPSSPVYNVKYVYVYDSTPEVVYVGYTPGYNGSYVYHNTIVYGTGWHYRPWVSPRYYYPRHSTWGFNVHYDPWYGWSYGLSWGWGSFSLGYYAGGYWHRNHYWHHRHYGHWGPRGYRHRAAHYDRHRYKHNRYGYNDHGRNRHGKKGRGHDGYDNYGRSSYRDNDRNRNGNGRNRNLYRDQGQRARIADTRDHSYRSGSGRGDVDRQVNDTRRPRNLDQRHTDSRKIGRDRLDPVRPADLAMKASLRDTRSRDRQRRALADSGRGSNRGTDRSTQRRDVSGRNITSKKAERNRITPSPRTGVERQQLASSRQKPIRIGTYSTQRRVATASQQRSTRANQKGNRQQDVAPVRLASSRTVVSSSRQQKSRVVEAPARQPQSRANNQQQRPAQAVPAPSRQQRGPQKVSVEQRSPKKSNSQQRHSQRAGGQQNRFAHQGGNRRGRGQD